VDLTYQHTNQILLVEGPEIKIRSVGARPWSMRERFCAEELQAMIDLYTSGATRSQVAERFGISVSSMKRVLRDHGIRKRPAASGQRPHGRDQTREQKVIFNKIKVDIIELPTFRMVNSPNHTVPG
jgi:hypothetical protein